MRHHSLRLAALVCRVGVCPHARRTPLARATRAPLALVLGIAALLTFVPSAGASLSVSDGNSLSQALTVAEGQWLDGGSLERAAAAAQRRSPEAIAARERSQSAWRHLNGPQIARLARAVFPSLVERSSAATLNLPSGTKLDHYETTHAALVTTPNGKQAVVESLTPIAHSAGHGRFEGLDLDLTSANGSYWPAATVAPVRFPRDLASGISSPDTGVTLTPVTAAGSPLHGAAATQDGQSVLYSETSTAADTLAKATPQGFDLETLVRSPESPENYYFHIAIPAGSRLIGGTDPGRPVGVETGDGLLAAILPPQAIAANGETVPVTMVRHGSTLVLHVPHSSSDEYPIMVDPETTDGNVTGAKAPTRWKFGPPGSPHFIPWGFGTESWLEIESTGEYKAGEGAYLVYETQGESHIYFTGTELKVQNEGTVEAILQLVHTGTGGHEEAEETKLIAPAHSEVSERTYFSVCAEYPVKPTCPLEGNWYEYGAPHNEVKLQESATANGSEYNHANLMWANVWIYQKNGPENPTFNSSEAQLASDGGRNNVFYGSAGGWLSPYSGAYEVKAKDPGVGIKTLIVKVPSVWRKEYAYFEEHLCEGVQCRPEVTEDFSYNSALPNGEDTVDVESQDSVGSWSKVTEAKLKVDATQPYNLKIAGIAESGAELTATPHEITAEATEGKKPTPSSGIREITATVDGMPVQPTTRASCTAIECTAKAAFVIHGEAYGVGYHHLIISAISGAGEEAKREITFATIAGSSVPIGPGRVDPITGQFGLQATDVDLGGVGGVARTYLSENTNTESPLGPQWKLDVGAGDELEVLPNGDAVLSTNSSSDLTSFQLDSSGEYEAPTGDTNLKLSYETKEHAYLLTDSTAGTVMKFTQPEGSQAIVPSANFAFGAAGSEEEQFASPSEDAVNAAGDLYVVDSNNDRIEKFSRDGEQEASYGTAGSGNGQFNDPTGIAINQANGDIYVSDTSNSRMEELGPTGTYIRAFGASGTGAGDLHIASGVAIDAHENIWVADTWNDRIDVFSATGTFLHAFGWGVLNGEAKLEVCTTTCKPGLFGAGGGEFDYPAAIAFSGGKAFVTDTGNNRVDVFSESETPAYEKAFGTYGTGNGQFKYPRGIATEPVTGDLYVVDYENNRVEVFNTAGTFQLAYGSTGTGEGQLKGPEGIAISPSGVQYIVDGGNDRVSSWARPTWMGTTAEGPAESTSATYDYKAVTVEGKPVIEPVFELGPKPSGVTCTAEPSKAENGCRELTFKYGTKNTTGSGEAPSEWGEYQGRLMQVLFTGYNPETKAMMVEQPVADYLWDSHGRLRQEWDPRIPGAALKTTYGYESENHLSSYTAPGVQPWLFHYGRLGADLTTGRLLSMMRPAAKTAMSIETQPINTVVPTLSSTKPVVGTKITVATNGTWSHNLTYAYTYTWSDCTTTGECTLIPGAVNQSYYPQTTDVGKDLLATVTAYSATGAIAAKTAMTSAVMSGTPTNPAPEPPSVGNLSVYTVNYNIPASGTGAPHELSTSVVGEWGQTDVPVSATAFSPPGEPMGWPAKSLTQATLQYLDSHGREVNVYAPSGGISTVEYNAANEVVRALTAENRNSAMLEGCGSPCASAEKAEKLDTKTEYEANNERIIKTTGPEHPIKLANGEEKEARLVNHFTYDEGAAEVEAVTHEKYALITKTVTAALLASGTETEERVTKTSYSGQSNLGWKLRAPTSITNDATGLKITHSMEYEPATGRLLETKSPLGNTREASFAFNIGHAGSEPGQFWAPSGMARDSKGNIWIAVAGGYGVSEFGSDGSFVRRFGEEGTTAGKTKAPEDLAITPSGNIYVADTGNNRIDKFSETGSNLGTLGSEGTGDLQFKSPGGIAITSSGTRWIADTANNRVQELNSKDEFVEAIGFGVTNGEAKFQTCTTACKAGIAGSGEGQFNKPRMVAVAPNGDVYVTDSENGRVEVFSSNGAFLSILGKKGTKAGEFTQPVAIAINTNGQVYVGDKGKSVVDEFKANNEFITSIGTKGAGAGEFETVTGVLVNPEGQLYVANEGVGQAEVEDWRIEAANAGAHNTLTVYYSSAANSQYKECGEHREWQGLVCETRPVAQPETKPELPVTLYTYNVWDASATSVETFGTVKRTKSKTFDSAGRVTGSEVTSTIDTAVPKTTDSYSETTGALEKQSTTTGTITTKRNGIGQISEYTDADGAITDYTYEEGGDARLIEVSQSRGTEAKAWQTYSYQPTTGVLNKLVDSALGTITETANQEGAPVSIVLPDGLTEKYTRNALGEVTKLEDVKSSHCGGNCVWFSDKVVPGILGEVLKQATTFAEEPKITVDEAGRPTEVEEIPTGKGCTVRKYGWNEDSDRTDVQTFAPGSEGKCATSAGAPNEAHTYDGADRLNDAGVAYETFGNTTTMPAADAAGHEITSTFYVDNQVATQTQNAQTLKYAYDPAGREREIVKEGTLSATVIEHYDEPGEAVAWTSEGTEKWTREIPGIAGSLAATQHVGESVVLLIHDLQGDVVATAADNETEEKFLTTYNSTEFGVPNEGKAPPAFAWLGSDGLKSELTISGIITNGAGSYVPEVARSLATEAVEPPGAVPQGSGPGAPYTTGLSTATIALGNALAAGAPAREAERQKALEEEARRRAAEAEAAADPKCTARVVVGMTTSSTGREWAYSRGWGWCGNDLLPKYTTLEVCLGSELEADDIAAGPASFMGDGCEWGFSGFEKNGKEKATVSQLYEHVHTPCEDSGITYRGYVWFWVAGKYATKNEPLAGHTKGFHCGGQDPITSTFEAFLLVAEFFPDVEGPKG